MDQISNYDKYCKNVIYGTTSHRILSVAVSLKRPFDYMDIVNTAPGVLRAKDRKSIFLGCAKRLASHGLLSQDENGKWVITDESATCLYVVAQKREQKKQRELGPRYMASVRERLARAQSFGFNMSKIDEEDAIIDEVNVKLATVLARKHRNATKRRNAAQGQAR